MPDSAAGEPTGTWRERALLLMEKRMEPAESKRATLVGFASIFGVQILPEEESLERSVDELIGFIADIDTLDLEGVAPASVYDPAWPRVNEGRS